MFTVLLRHIRRIAVGINKVRKGHLHLNAQVRLSYEHYSILSGSASRRATPSEHYLTVCGKALPLIPQSTTERDFHRQVLKHLMTYRNRTIHTGYTTEDIETLLYQLKRYVDLALLFHIYSAPDFASIGESVS